MGITWSGGSLIPGTAVLCRGPLLLELELGVEVAVSEVLSVTTLGIIWPAFDNGVARFLACRLLRCVDGEPDTSSLSLLPKFDARGVLGL